MGLPHVSYLSPIVHANCDDIRSPVPATIPRSFDVPVFIAVFSVCYKKLRQKAKMATVSIPKVQILDITVEDHAVPQLLTSALEAYEVGDRVGRRRTDKLETFGLLWGYVISGRKSRNPHVVVTAATVETSALRKNDSVMPDLDSLRMKTEFFSRYWPHLEAVGTFHSHPYESLENVRECRGWRASTPNANDPGGDTVFWPQMHEELFCDTPYLAHLVVTVTSLSKKGWAVPGRMRGGSGYEMSMGYRKLWITSYGTEAGCTFKPAMMKRLPSLDIPSLTMRALKE